MRRIVCLLLLLLGGMHLALAQDVDRAEVKDLVAELTEQDAHVRKVAHDSLVAMGDAVIPILAAMLPQEAPDAQRGICRVLKTFGPRAKEALPALEALAKDTKRKDVWAPANQAIHAIRPKKPAGGGKDDPQPDPEPSGELADVETLLARLDSQKPGVALGAVRDLGRHGAAAKPAVQKLGTMVEKGPPDFRLAAAETLGRIGPDAELAFPALLAQATDAKPPLSYRCRDAIALIGGRVALPLIRELAVSPDARAWAPGVLWEMGSQAVPATTEALRAEDAALQRAGVDALGYVGEPAASEAVVTDLAARLEHATGGMRRSAAAALGRMGRPAKTALPALVKLARDPKRRAQREAVRAIALIAADLARDRSEKKGRSRKLDAAIDDGLAWLAAHQDVRASGRWDCKGFMKHDPEDDLCTGGGMPHYDTGVTGLATLAFLMRSEWVRLGDGEQLHGTNIRAALRYLLSTQMSSGALGTKYSTHNIYNHAIATIALCRAWAESRNPLYEEPARRALDYLESHRNPELAWRYEPRQAKSDTSVTVWCVWALREGQSGGLLAEHAAFAGAIEWLDLVTKPESGRTGYMDFGRPARANALLDRFPPKQSEALTAAALHARMIVGVSRAQEPLVKLGYGLLSNLLPDWDEGSGRNDFYYWYHGTFACMWRGGVIWRKWSRALESAVLPRQNPEGSGSRAGSWDPVDPWAPDGGRVYATAAILQCLEIVNGYETRGRTAPTMEGRVRVARKALGEIARDAADEVVRRDAARAVAALRAIY